MPLFKYFDIPDSVQTSLFGFDKNKKVQLNCLRGKPIVVVRNDVLKNKSVERPQNRYDDSSWPSYAHFHHQCGETKVAPTTKNANYSLTGGGRNHILDKKSKEIDDQLNVKRVFDKLAISSCSLNSFTPDRSMSSSSSVISPVSNDVTILQLNPEFEKRTARHILSDAATLTPSDTYSTLLVGDDTCSLKCSSMARDIGITPPSSCSSDILVKSDEEANNAYSSCSSKELDDPCDGDIEDEDEMEREDENEKLHTCSDKYHCEVFRNGDCCNEDEEKKEMLRWYNDLIQWRHDVLKKKCFGPPRCPPPPLTVTLIGASRAQRINPFLRFDGVHPFVLETMFTMNERMGVKRPQKLVPHELPLPAPHEFMANAKCMEPHLFVEYCYQLTAGGYIDVGLNPPTRVPPIPPRFEPLPKEESKDEQFSYSSECSSSGEYSEDIEEEENRIKMSYQKRCDLRKFIEEYKKRFSSRKQETDDETDDE